MENKNKLSEYTDKELLQEEKKLKDSVKYKPFIIGFLAGIAIWSAVKGGFVLPFILLGIILYLINADKKYKAIKAEIESREI